MLVYVNVYIILLRSILNVAKAFKIPMLEVIEMYIKISFSQHYFLVINNQVTKRYRGSHGCDRMVHW